VVARPRRLLVIPLGVNTNPAKKLARPMANTYLTGDKEVRPDAPASRAVIAAEARPARALWPWDPGPPMRLLIIEDDHDAADYLTKAFREVGHVADRAFDGEEGLALALDTPYDVLIVDRMLPKLDGLNLIGRLRAKGVTTPALILSALGQVDDRVKGLRAGSDDYLSKPYAFSELLARVEVLARRRGGRGEDTVYRVGDLELDRLSHRVSRAEAEIVLQPREFRLLEYLMKHAGQVVTRTMLLENVWDYHFDPQTNVIDVHISRLRSKIDKGFARPLLHTVRGAGYMIRDGAR
jgi:two-component system, OmpR family, response regulator